MCQRRPLEQCTRWFDILATHLPVLSRAELRTLALWSYATTLTQHVASTTCASFLGRLFDQPYASVLQRLREFYREAAVKRGRQRRTLDVTICFAPLLSWVFGLYRWAARREETLVLALDATLCRDRLTLLAISVVFQGSALPVAWKILPAQQVGSWVGPCLRLIEQLKPALPADQRVVLLCDRGLQSPRLYRAITRQGWHPMMRLIRIGLWRPSGSHQWYALGRLLRGPGRYYVGRGELFKSHPMACTLVALWEEGYEEPWLLMTDLAPADCRGAFYGLRRWIEQGFRVMKSGAYHCERLRVTDPERAERIWLVLAVSMIWTHAVGARQRVAEEPCGRWAVMTGTAVRRVLGIHRKGWIEILVSALRGEELPWPCDLLAASEPSSPPGITVALDIPP